VDIFLNSGVQEINIRRSRQLVFIPENGNTFTKFCFTL